MCTLQGLLRPLPTAAVFARLLILALVLALALTVSGGALAAPPPVMVLQIEGAIGPATADYIVRGLEHAAEEGAQLAVIKMDTPGGLDLSMRQMIKAILASPVPVATYVAPNGARAASAGTYILYASHIAAMAPATNLGAATPVQIGGASDSPSPAKPTRNPPASDEAEPGAAPSAGTAKNAMTSKQISDAAAYIRSLAQLRGRNAEWAERAVREAVSLPANEALKIGVVDYIAADLSQLLQQLDGKTITVVGDDIRLDTTDAPIINYEPDWRARILAVITNPSIALILMMIGVYGLFFEFTGSGFGIAGVLGGICLLLGLYSLHLLPLNYAGLALILLGISFMVAEAFAPSFGVLGIGGVIAFVLGALILIDTELAGYGIPLTLIIPIAVVSALLIGLVGNMALKVRRQQVVTGDEALINSIGEMQSVAANESAAANEGWAQVRGESWRVTSNTALQRGQKVRILARNGLMLHVEPAEVKTEY